MPLPPHRSNFWDANVQKAFSALSQAANQTQEIIKAEAVSRSASQAPKTSALADSRVAMAIQNLSALQPANDIAGIPHTEAELAKAKADLAQLQAAPDYPKAANSTDTRLAQAQSAIMQLQSAPDYPKAANSTDARLAQAQSAIMQLQSAPDYPKAASATDTRLAQAQSAIMQMQAAPDSLRAASATDTRLAQAQSAIMQMQAAPDYPKAASATDTRLAQARANLAQMQPVQDYPHGATMQKSSAMTDPAVRQAIASLAQVQPAQVMGAGSAKPGGSAFTAQEVRQALEQTGQLQSGPPHNLITIKNALNGGELAPEMLARFDLPRFQTGCELLFNLIPLATGGVTKRPGLRFVSGTGAGNDVAARLIPFVYSTELAYMLMFLANSGGGQLYILDRDGKQGATAACTFPYKNSELASLSICQCGKILYAAHSNHKPAKFIFNGSTFSYQTIDFANHVPIPSIANLQIVGEPNSAWGWRTYVVTAVDANGRESYPSDERTLDTSALSQVFKCRITINKVSGCNEYRIYKKRGCEFGFIGRITDSSNYFDDEGYSPDTSDPPPERKTWFANAGDYPSICFLHQQRLGFAASNNDPLTIWMSQTSNFEGFESKKPPQDDDSLEVTLASTQANRILWCISDRTGLAVGTSGEEWYLTGADGTGSVTPNSLAFQQQTGYGTESGLKPVRANSSLLFVQRGGRYVRDFGYAFQADKYEAQDLTLMARHLFRFTQIADMAWQDTPLSILWCVMRNGNLLGLTYMPEEKVVAWHKHNTPEGKIISCATLFDSEGRSRLWLIVTRPEGTHIEMLDNVFEGQPSVWDKGTANKAIPEHVDGQAKREYSCRLIPCLPETGMENGNSSMRVNKINSVKLRVINSAPIKYLLHDQYKKSTIAERIPVKGLMEKKEPYAEQATDWTCPVAGGFREGSKLEFVLDGKAPATILGIAVTLDIAREGGGQLNK